MRASSVLLALVLAGLAPLGWALSQGLGPAALPGAVGAGIVAAVAAVGWVVLPQLVLAVAIFGLALEQLATRLAGRPPGAAPAWLPAAVESALLLGMLGTISGMVTGFVELSPEALEPGPLVQSLGRALRSSFVGFGIALVGVWTQSPATPGVALREAAA